MQRQLPLPIVTSAPPGFDNFTRGSNHLAVDMVASLGDSSEVRQIFLCGAPQSGKSHLLTALHRQYLTAGKRSFYVSLEAINLAAGTHLTPALLDSLDSYDLIAIDDVDCVARHPLWEKSLFNMINFSRDREGKLIFSASSAPSMENWDLADLVSRFSWGPVLKLQPLNETEIREAMLSAAQQRGMKFDSGAVDFLLKRYRRDTSSLLSAIAILDSDSIAAGRDRITIPFLKQCFDFD